MNLFLIVYERDESCDWFFKTSRTNELDDDDKVRKLIANHYDIDFDMFDDYIDDYYVSKVSEADDYKIKLVKE